MVAYAQTFSLGRITFPRSSQPNEPGGRARQLTGRTDAALLAGVAFACSPYRLAHAYHLQVLVSGWMPIAFYGQVGIGFDYRW